MWETFILLHTSLLQTERSVVCCVPQRELYNVKILWQEMVQRDDIRYVEQYAPYCTSVLEFSSCVAAVYEHKSEVECVFTSDHSRPFSPSSSIQSWMCREGTCCRLSSMLHVCCVNEGIKWLHCWSWLSPFILLSLPYLPLLFSPLLCFSSVL